MIKERAKTVLIFALVFSMLTLMLKYWYEKSTFLMSGGLPEKYSGTILSDIMNTMTGERIESTEESVAEINKNFITPSVIMLTKNGQQYTVAWDNAYSEIGASKMSSNNMLVNEMLSEIFDTANKNDYTKSDKEEWDKAILSDGIYIDYGKELPVSAIKAASGAESKTVCQFYTRYIFISVIDEAKDGEYNDYGILFKSESGECNKSKIKRVLDTTALFDELRISGSADWYRPSDKKIYAENILTKKTVNLNNITIDSYGINEDGQFTNEAVTSVLNAFEYYTSPLRKYNQEDAVVYVDSGNVVAFYNNGRIEYRAEAFTKGISVAEMLGIRSKNEVNEEDYIKAADMILKRMDGRLTGGYGSLEINGVRFDQAEGCTVIEFSYYLYGMKINGGEDAAARIKIKEGNIYYVELTPGNYVLDDKKTRLMNPSETIEIAKTELADGEYIKYIYPEYEKTNKSDNTMTFVPRWIIKIDTE